MLKSKRFYQLALSLVSLTAASCGQNNQTQSDVDWAPISGTSKALLETRDLEDKFLFGFRVVNTKNFFTSALSMDLRPSLVSLKISKSSPTGPEKLFAVDAADKFGGAALMAFDLKKVSQDNLEIDFASENYIDLTEGYVNQVGGQFTSGSKQGAQGGVWKTKSGVKPRVLKVVQDKDTLVVDVEHFVQFTQTNGATASVSKDGSITMRVFLIRQGDTAPSTNRTVGASRANNFGFFSADMGAKNIDQAPIAHYDFSTRTAKTVYLKDFPADMVEPATSAVKAWNIPFGFNAFEVKIAPQNVDIGDPRYNVIKWFDGLDNEVSWAGYAPTMADPTTGSVMATQILINGDLVRNQTTALSDYTNQASVEFKALGGSIAGVPLVQGVVETPIVSFFTNPSQKDSKAFVRGYYYGVIMHEFGHSLGLRHNFAASTLQDPDGTASSVMDYEPNFIADTRTAIGSYDSAAIKYGYLNQSPATKRVFCTDENVETSYVCNRGDIGNPADFAASSVLNGVQFLKLSQIALPAHVKMPMMGSMKSVLTLENKARWSARCEQLPGSEIVSAKLVLDKAKELMSAELVPSLIQILPGIQRQNMMKVFASFTGAVQESEGAESELTTCNRS